MSRLVVEDREHGTEAPFLRGILTRSLQESGLDFDEAYELSSDIRSRLLSPGPNRDGSEPRRISSRQLQATVIRSLRRKGRQKVLDRYRARHVSHEPVVVQRADGQTSPFMHGYHLRSLQSCGLSADEASAVSSSVYQQLLANPAEPVSPLEIDWLTYTTLQRELGDAVSHRYMVWRDFLHSGRPLILLIGGTAGCGKSTIATGVANRLEIVRTQSTDMLREVMRVMLPERLLPVLHRSSFDAWEEIPRGQQHEAEPEADIADGFVAQAELLAVACEAVVQRAIRERVSLILEGVHVHPALIGRITTKSDALVVPIMLAVLNSKTLRDRISGRGSKVPGRRSKRYLRSFDAIWALQSFLLSEADRAGVPIILNDNEERVFLAVMRLVLDRLSSEFTSSAEEVFSTERVRPRHITS